jgi:glycosyltransferase involved in cell wall biosynthesis
VSILALEKAPHALLERFTPWVPAATPSNAMAMQKPTLSVVIPAFNEAQLISSTLASVVAVKNHYNGPVEIIVVDNNSTDATAEIARSCGATVVFEAFNQIARARNAGAAAAKGDYLIFLDADTRLQGDILDKVASHLSSGQIIGGGAWAVPDTNWLGQLLFKYFINYALALKNVTTGAFLYCQRTAFERAGGFDETLYAAEEFAFAKRLQAAGKKEHKKWAIITYHKNHRVITSARRFGKLGGLEMLLQNAHLLWNPLQKLQRKDQCRFWYEGR